MRTVSTAPFVLNRTGEELSDLAEELYKKLGGTSLEAVLAEANRLAPRKGRLVGVRREVAADWYTFDEGDNATVEWYPQGVASSSEAGVTGVRAMLVSWYWKPTTGVEKGIRLSALDLTTGRYRHILLVEPRPGATYRPINIHAGGIAWCGNLLYVADTVRGLRVFDLRHLIDLKAVPKANLTDKTRVGLHGGVYHAFGYRYVLPQVGAWHRAGEARFSFAAVDRSARPHTLISGEYTDPGTPLGRVVRWSLGADGTPGAPIDAFQLPQSRIQGATCHRGRWYLSQGRGSRADGVLLVVKPDGTITQRAYGRGPEDLTVHDGRLWTVTEFPNKRVLFAVDL